MCVCVCSCVCSFVFACADVVMGWKGFKVAQSFKWVCVWCLLQQWIGVHVWCDMRPHSRLSERVRVIFVQGWPPSMCNGICSTYYIYLISFRRLEFCVRRCSLARTPIESRRIIATINKIHYMKCICVCVCSRTQTHAHIHFNSK